MTDEDLDGQLPGARSASASASARSPALLMIDFVEAYFDRGCALYAGVEDALASAIRLQARGPRKAGIPVIYTNVVYNKSALNGGRFYQKSMTLHNFIEGSPMGAWPKGLVVGDDELVISKQYPSAFFGTSLASTLTTLGVDTLIHTGVSDQRLRARHLRRLLLPRLHPDHRARRRRRPPQRPARGQPLRHGRQVRRRRQRGRGHCLSPADRRRSMTQAQASAQRSPPATFVAAPGIHDMITAVVSNKVGFDFVYASGYWMTASAYGLPDAGIASYTQMLDRVATLCRTVNASVIADADTGYGGLLNVHHTVRGYEEAGVVGDPDRGPGIPQEVRPHAVQARGAGHRHGREGQGRARGPAQPEETLIIARTDARQTDGFEGALKRGIAYGEAGADIVFLEALESEAGDARGLRANPASQ